jgi:hypothetical protein
MDSAHATMSHEQEADILERIETLAKLGGLLKLLFGGACAIGVGILGVAGWVWTQSATNATQTEEIRHLQTATREHDAAVRAISTWRATTDATPRVSQQEVYLLDKRLQRVEDQGAAIVESLRRIEGKIGQ